MPIRIGTDRIGRLVVGDLIDPDALAFLTATGITDPTIESAINTLVIDLKGYGIWNKMEVIYPFTGGTATTNKYNLINPLDTDVAYRINFQNAWTHDPTGSLPTINNAYGNTYFNPSTYSNISTGMSWGYYMITGPSSQYIDKYSFGGYTGGSAFLSIEERDAAGTETDFKYCSNNADFRVNASVLSTGEGFRQFSSPGSASGEASVSNASGTATDTGVPSGAYPNLNLFVGNLNLNGSPYISNKTYLAFAYMGTPLTAPERTDYFTAVQTFQTTLSRQV